MKKFFVMPLVIGMIVVMTILGGCREKVNADWSRKAVFYEVNIRQYTKVGTVVAFADELPRLHDLGVDALLFMPVNPVSELNRRGTLGSCYAVADYRAFNPEFGSVDDFIALVGKAHRMGMKVLIDWVADRAGCDNTWLSDHPDWFLRDSVGLYVTSPDGDTYKLDYSNGDMRTAMIDAMRYWVDAVGVDGFRCDDAAEVPADFWAEARKQLLQIKPYMAMIADSNETALIDEAFDMGCNTDMIDLFRDIAATSGQYFYKYEGEDTVRKYPKHHGVAIDSLLARQRDTDGRLMLMTSNHRLNSCEGAEFDRLGILYRPFAVLSYTLPGMPMIYTGQEAGFSHALKQFDKDLPPQWTPRVDAYFSFYKTLNDLKHSHPALRDDEAVMVRYPTDNPDLYAFSRTADGHTVWVFANIGPGDTYVTFSADAPQLSKSAINVFTGKPEAIPTYLAPAAVFLFAD